MLHPCLQRRETNEVSRTGVSREVDGLPKNGGVGVLVQLAEHGEQAYGGVDLGGVLVAFFETALREREGERESEGERKRDEGLNT